MKRLFASLVIGFLALAPIASAQDATPGEHLGGYDVQSAAMAVSFQPVFPALLPTGDAPFEATLALTTSRVKSGGNAFGRAAIVWPGSAASDPGPLIGAGFGQNELGGLFPKWPLQAQANQDAGEVVTGTPPGVTMRATGHPDRASGDSRGADLNVPNVLRVSAIASTSSSVVTDTAVSSIARAALKGVSIGGGYITAEGIRSVSRTTSTGSDSTSSGDVDIVGMKIGGADVSVTDDGFKVTGLPPDFEPMPGAGGEPFPGQSPEQYVQQVLDFMNARITLFKGDGSRSGGRADHFELGVVLSIDNPIGGQGPFPPGHFDIILASTSSIAAASPPFTTSGVPDVTGGSIGGSGGTRVSQSATLGGGRSVGEGTLQAVGETVGEESDGPAGEVAFGDGGFVDADLQRSDYKFGGVPMGMVIGLLFLAVLAARSVRNFFVRLMAEKETAS